LKSQFLEFIPVHRVLRQPHPMIMKREFDIRKAVKGT
jgi:hypothetical protein